VPLLLTCLVKTSKPSTCWIGLIAGISSKVFPIEPRAARTALAELEKTAEVIQTPYMAALVAHAAGQVGLAEDDPQAALPLLKGVGAVAAGRCAVRGCPHPGTGQRGVRGAG
jgi:hypothetical protein